jgi:hypothetical protein
MNSYHVISFLGSTIRFISRMTTILGSRGWSSPAECPAFPKTSFLFTEKSIEILIECDRSRYSRIRGGTVVVVVISVFVVDVGEDRLVDGGTRIKDAEITGDGGDLVCR